jgi:protein-tyrosine phosphatase
MKMILIVCIANICRSPIAEAIFKKNRPDWTVISAGINAFAGHPADANSIEVCRRMGLNIAAHRAVLLNQQLMQFADHVFVMDAEMDAILKKKYPAAAEKIKRLGEHVGLEIEDPYKKDIDAFIRVADNVNTSIDQWLSRIGV